MALTAGKTAIIGGVKHTAEATPSGLVRFVANATLATPQSQDAQDAAIDENKAAAIASKIAAVAALSADVGAEIAKVPQSRWPAGGLDQVLAQLEAIDETIEPATASYDETAGTFQVNTKPAITLEDVAAATSINFADQTTVDAGTNETEAINSLTLQTRMMDWLVPYMQSLGWTRSGGVISEGTANAIVATETQFRRINPAGELQENAAIAAGSIEFVYYDRRGQVNATHDGTAINGAQTAISVAVGADGEAGLIDITAAGTDSNDGTIWHIYQNPLDGSYAITLPQAVANNLTNAKRDSDDPIVLHSDLEGWHHVGWVAMGEAGNINAIKNNVGNTGSNTPTGESIAYVQDRNTLQGSTGYIDGQIVISGTPGDWEAHFVVAAGATFADSTTIDLTRNYRGRHNTIALANALPNMEIEKQ